MAKKRAELKREANEALSQLLIHAPYWVRSVKAYIEYLEKTKKG